MARFSRRVSFSCWALIIPCFAHWSVALSGSDRLDWHGSWHDTSTLHHQALSSHLPHNASHRACVPHNVHIAFHNNPSQMTVMWMTRHDKCPSNVKFQRQVDAWEGEGTSRELTHGHVEEQHGIAASLASSDMCREPARSDSYEKTWQHSVVLNGLQPGGRYRYTVADDTAKYTFTAAPPEDSTSKTNFIMYGDMGVSDMKAGKAPGAGSVMEAVQNEIAMTGSDFVLHVGDISYGDGRGEVWDAFMEQISSFASGTPYMVGAGNHDYDYRGHSPLDPSHASSFWPDNARIKYSSNGECGVALKARFRMPSRGSGELAENPPFWYSFEHNLVHIVMLSSEHSLKRHGEQWEWLVAHLKSIDRCKTPWVVVALHRPLYAIKPHDNDRVIAKYLRHHLEDVFVKYGVDVVASGHLHAYSRTCPVIDKHCLPYEMGSVLHVVTGSGGRKLTEVGGMQKWLEFSERTFGFSRFTVEETGEGESEMVVEFVNAAGGVVTDTVTLRNSLRRDGHCSYCYSRSNGAVPRSPEATGAVSARGVRPECGEGHGSGDLDTLAEQRLAAEHPKWAAALGEEVPTEWMISDPEESRTVWEGSMGHILGRMGAAWDAVVTPADETCRQELVRIEDPDAE